MIEHITDADLRKQVAQWTRIALGDLLEENGALSKAVPNAEQPSTIIPIFIEYHKEEDQPIDFSEQQDATERHILIVESDPILAQLLCLVLSDERRYTCFAASNCLSALKFATFSRPDLLLLNTHLPDGDGIALYDCLHAKKCLAAVPAVILSTQLPYYQNEIDARQLVACEMPFELGSLLGTVDNVLS
jgi:CheY-like chemotaxis protein